MARSRLDSKRRALHTGEYERKQGGYEYRWREPAPQDFTGKGYWKQRAIVADTLEELRELEKQIKKDQLDGIAAKQSLTLDALVDSYFQAKRGLRENTRRNYQYMYGKFIRDTSLGRKKVQDIKRSDIIKFYNKLVDDGKVSISTLETLQNVVLPALSQSVDDDIIRKNPAANALKDLKREDREKKTRDKALGNYKRESLTLHEQKLFLDAIAGTPFENVFKFDLLTGLRVGELCGLTWDCVDYDKKLIHIKQTLVYFEHDTGKCAYAMHATKTKAGTRDLVLTDELEKILTAQRADYDKFIQDGGKMATVDGVTGFIFFNRYGSPHKQDTLNRSIKRIVAKHNDSVSDEADYLPSFSCHKIRKTFASNQIRAGIDLSVLCAKMGHTSPETTVKVYIDCQRDISQDADEKTLKLLREKGVL